jgi:hypothetical protein
LIYPNRHTLEIQNSDHDFFVSLVLGVYWGVFIHHREQRVEIHGVTRSFFIFVMNNRRRI